MSIKQTLTMAAICALALTFNASANVAYDNEVTNDWFSVTAASAAFDDGKWTMPDEGEVSKDDQGINLDTDLDDPLTYTPVPSSTNVAIVSASFEATANASVPTLTATPQAALTVVVEDAATNWCGLVGGEEPSWVKFESPVPVVGTNYDIKIEFDLKSSPKKIRYSVDGTVLGTGWYTNPQTNAGDHITSVSFAGTGGIGNFDGKNVVEAAAGFNGVNYTTFEAAMEAARATWTAEKPVVLYKNAKYAASATEKLYIDVNDHEFEITGSVAVDWNGSECSITAGDACEAKIGDTYYSTIENAIIAATAGQTITVNKALNKALTFDNTSVTLDTNSKTVTCATLTVADGVTLTLDDALAVTTATINGAVEGETLTVNGTLTGVNVAKLTFGDAATFAYAGTPLAAATLGTALRVTGLSTAAVGATVIASVATEETTFTDDLPTGKCLEVAEGALKVASVAEITKVSEDEGYDYTNGTVNVTATVKSGTATAELTVIGWDGTTTQTVSKAVTSGTKMTWDVADVLEGALTQGGAYTYTVDIKVGDEVVATKSGEFTAAKWGADGAWFKADATSGVSVVWGGGWQTQAPAIGEDRKYEVSDSRFNVTSEAGSNKFTRVDTKIAFESLVDDTPDKPEDAAVGGFVATTLGWMALDAGEWVLLTGALDPVTNKEYMIRTEFDFAAETKRMRFFVAEGDGDFLPLAKADGSQWLTTGVANQETLKAVEFQGTGKLSSINATVADKALFEVNGKKFDTMAEALEEAGTNGTKITLLTNATITPTKAGKYEIVAGNYHYVSGGKDSTGNRTIIVSDNPDEPPVVRPTDAEMQKVKAPGGKPYRSYDSLRKFLEKNKVGGYTNDTADAQSVSNALMTAAENDLLLWQDYALGIDKNTSVEPVATPAGDTNPEAITLAIPTIDKSKYSGDYTIRYQVMKGSDSVSSEGNDADPSAILIPLGDNCTGTYTIKAVFTPAE